MLICSGYKASWAPFLQLLFHSPQTSRSHRRNKVGVRQIRDGDVLCAESQVLCRAVEGVGSFGTVIELNILKKHTAVIYMVLAAALQPLVGGQQIQRRKQRVILSVYILCGKCKSCPVLFIYICHGVFLAFYIFVESLAEGRTAYLPHGGRQYLRGCGGGCRDEYLCFGKTEAHRLRRCRCNRRVRPCEPLCAAWGARVASLHPGQASALFAPLSPRLWGTVLGTCLFDKSTR